MNKFEISDVSTGDSSESDELMQDENEEEVEREVLRAERIPW